MNLFFFCSLQFRTTKSSLRDQRFSFSFFITFQLKRQSRQMSFFSLSLFNNMNCSYQRSLFVRHDKRTFDILIEIKNRISLVRVYFFFYMLFFPSLFISYNGARQKKEYIYMSRDIWICTPKQKKGNI